MAISARRAAALAATPLLALGLVGIAAAPAHAATFTVTSFAELWDAIDDANGTPAADTIVLSGDDADFTFTDNPPVIVEPLTIEGPGQGFVLDADTYYGFAAVDAEAVVFRGFTLDDAWGNSSPYVGAITASATAVTIDDVAVTNSYWDGAYVDGGPITVIDSTFSENGADGLDIDFMDGGDSSITASSFLENGRDGLEIQACCTDVTVSDVVASGNGTSVLGGNGIYVDNLDGAITFVLDGVTADDNATDGVVIVARHDSVAELSDISADGNGDDGIDLNAVGDDDAPTITATGLVATGQQAGDFEGPGDAGIGVELSALDGGVIEVSDVEATGNDIGIHLYGDDTTVNEVEGADVTEFASPITVSGANASGNEIGGFVAYGDGLIALLEDSTFDSNEVGLYVMGDDVWDEGEGDAYYADFEVTLAGSTVSNNEAPGIYAWLDYVGAFTVVNSTISGNNTEGHEGAAGLTVVSYGGPQSFSLLNSTVTDNNGYAGLDIRNSDSALVSHSIVSGNHAELADLVFGAWVEEGPTDVAVEWSILGTTAEYTLGEAEGEGDLGFGIGLEGARDLVAATGVVTAGVEAAALVEGEGVELDVTDPGLEPLADNGGPTQTHLLLSTSPALDGGDPDYAGGLETDQRGESRIQGSAIDIGAVEVDQTLPATGTEAEGALGAATLLLLLGAGLLTARSLRRRTA